MISLIPDDINPRPEEEIAAFWSSANRDASSKELLYVMDNKIDELHRKLDRLSGDDLVAPPEVEKHGSLSVVVPMDDMKDIVAQLWKSRATEERVGELWRKYKDLIFELDKEEEG